MFERHGYRERTGDVLFARTLIDQARREGLAAGLISGPPGVGKTKLAEVMAAHLGWSFHYLLCHHWVTEEDLFVKIDPAHVAALAGGVESSKEGAYRPGVLLRGIKSAPAVVVIDELDKAPERVDALLLDFLQTGLVRGPFGEVWRATHPVIVVMTDNGMRKVSEPLLRRVFRYSMSYLPQSVEADIVRRQTGASAGVVRMVVAMAAIIRKDGQTSPSLQEMVRLCSCLRNVSSAEEAELLIRGFLVKEDEDWRALTARFGQPGAVLWGEVKRSR